MDISRKDKVTIFVDIWNKYGEIKKTLGNYI